tara:strand:+ start:1681 stop:1893 length:213 start_codon:yes stop_codon:yes gene_type:complete
MTSPEEYMKKEDREKQGERFKSMTDNKIESVLSSVENVLDKGSFNLSMIDDVKFLRDWVAKVRYGNTISS